MTELRTRELDLLLPDGRALHVYEAGDPSGQPVLVHHGTPGSGMLMPAWIADARLRGICLIGYDRPGYGGSDRHLGRSVADVASDVAAIADAYGASRLLTWGFSGGGPHALACAAVRPDRIAAAAALASVAPYDAEGLDWSEGMGESNLDEFAAARAGETELRTFLDAESAGIGAAGADGLAEALRTLLPPVDRAALTGEVADFFYANMTRGLSCGVDGWLDDDVAFIRPWGFDLSAITVPLLVTQGRHDLMVPYSHGEWLVGHIAGAQALLLPDDGHITRVTRVDDVHSWLLEQRL
jgi:pimeloyl-ACP methyl ester carboxylesterase